jgi:hypothetical protein
MSTLIQILQQISEILGVDMLFTYVGFARVVFALVFFAYIGYCDWKTRRIPRHITGPFTFEIPDNLLEIKIVRQALHLNKDDQWQPGIPTWKTALAVAFPLLVYEMANSIPQILWPRIAANIGIATVMGYGMYKLPQLSFVSDRWKIFHSGDLKALLLIGILIPTYPFAGPVPVFRPSYDVGFFIISVLQWTAVIGTVYATFLTISNLVKSGTEFRFPASTLGYVTDVSDLHKDTNRRVLHREGKLTFDGLPAEMVSDYLNWTQKEGSNVSHAENFSDIEEVRLERFLIETEWGISKEEALRRRKEEAEQWENDIALDSDYMKAVSDKESVWVMPDIPLVSIMAGGIWLASLIGDPLYLIFNFI